MDIVSIQEKLRKFARDRDWEHFHNPKNLAMALAAEAGELLEIFQWLNEKQSRDVVRSGEDMEAVFQEIADIFIYLLRLADTLNVDVEEAVNNKIALNEKKYPVSLSRGNATKYSRRKK